jgi:signal transduction histidine kinase
MISESGDPFAKESFSAKDAGRLLRHVRSLADMSAEIAAAHDFPTTVRLLLLTLLGALSATRGALWLLEEELWSLQIAATRGLSGEGASLTLSPAECTQLLESASPLPISAAQPEPHAILREVGSRWPELTWAVPLVMREQLVGLIAIGAKLNRQPYSQSELELLATLATMSASGIHSHRLIAGLQVANQRLRDAQEQLIRSEQLATLGATTAGIAHEIGNPLQAITGFAHLIQQMAAEITPGLLNELIEPIVNESERLRLILDELRDYAKPKGYELDPARMSELVDETIRLTVYDPLFRNRVEVSRRLEADPPVRVNRNKIKQVLLNLLKNAAQAMSNRERPHVILVRVSAKGPAVRIRVCDNGPGIPPAQLDRIWEPFFTTKGREGTGLGLDLCRQIVERHGGRIWAESEVGVGSTFTIELPTDAQSSGG